MPPPKDNRKLCPRCKLRKPIREFHNKLHRLCIACEDSANIPQVVEWLSRRSQPPPQTPVQTQTAFPEPSQGLIKPFTAGDEPLVAPPAPPRIEETRTLTQWEQAAAWATGDPNKGLTSTYEGWKKYNRERARGERLIAQRKRDMMRELNGQPKAKPPDPYKLKKCIKCQQMKPPIRFQSLNVRICLACDGPPLSFVPGKE